MGFTIQIKRVSKYEYPKTATMATPTPSSSSSQPTTSTEYTLPSPPSDPISSIAFYPSSSAAAAASSSSSSSSPVARQFLVSSWDSTVRLYQLSDASGDPKQSGENKSAGTRELHVFRHEAPVLDVCWITETLAASGGVDRRVRLLDLATGEATIIGKHSSAISRIRYDPTTNLLLSTSWDRTLQLWDPLASPPRHLKTLVQPDKVLAMDTSPPHPSSPLLDPSPSSIKSRVVLAMTGRQVRIYDLTDLRSRIDSSSTSSEEDTGEWEPEQSRESSLKYMIRDVRCTPDGKGYATSSIEGRISVEFFDPSPQVQAKKYAFKCHRVVVDGFDTVYPVNCLRFHPIHGSFLSLGSDRTLSIWDPLLKKRIRQLPLFPQPLNTAAFSSDGNILVVGAGADVEEVGGEPVQGNSQTPTPTSMQGTLWIREKADEECKPKPAKTSS